MRHRSVDLLLAAILWSSCLSALAMRSQGMETHITGRSLEASGQSEWKLYGPDLDGSYGGENGTGGLDGTSPYLNLFYPTIADARGDILGEITNGAVSWNSSRPASYGAVPGYRPAAFGSGADLAQSSSWRGREVDITGFYNLGARTYDPIAGNWLSFDPVWNSIDPEGYTFCGGDPIDLFDPSGRMGKQALQEQWRNFNVGAAFIDDQFINALAGTGYLVNEGAYLATGDPGFSASARQYQSQMSPFARQGYYNPSTPTARLASAFTMFVEPGSAPARFGTMEATVARDVAPTITTESVQATETAAVQNGVANNSTRLGTAQPQQLLLSAPQQPVALLPENAESLAVNSSQSSTKALVPYSGTTTLGWPTMNCTSCSEAPTWRARS